MIYLIVGKPGEGKTQYAVSLLCAMQKENTRIEKKIAEGKALSPKESVKKLYADIDGLNMDGVDMSPDDWRDAPDGSIIFYDEVQYRKEYEDVSGKYSQNPMIKDLSKIRHSDIDLYLITQDPKRLERSIRGLTDALYLVKRPLQKPPFSTIYTFDRFMNDPYAAVDSKVEPKKYHDSKVFHYKKEYYSLYNSASAHTSMRFTIQKKFIYAILAIVVMLFFAYKLFMIAGYQTVKTATSSGAFSNIGIGDKTNQKQLSKSTTKQESTSTQLDNTKPVDDKTHELQRIAFVVQSSDGSCFAKNSYGELIDTQLDRCRYFADHPSMLTVSRLPQSAPDWRRESMNTDPVNIKSSI